MCLQSDQTSIIWLRGAGVACQTLIQMHVYVGQCIQGHLKWQSKMGQKIHIVKDHALFDNLCYTCPRSSLPWVLQIVLRRPKTWAKAGACIANIVLHANGCL